MKGRVAAGLGQTYDRPMEQAIGPYRVADLERMPEEERWELIEGELVMSPTPRLMHQKVAYRLAVGFARLEEAGQASVFVSGTGVFLAAHTVLAPDLVVMSPKSRERFSERGIEGPADLVVEVLSPSTKKRDLAQKRRLYAAYGVGEYWIVHPTEQWVEVLSLHDGDYRVDARYTPPEVLRSRAFPTVGLPLAWLFAPV